MTVYLQLKNRILITAYIFTVSENTLTSDDYIHSHWTLVEQNNRNKWRSLKAVHDGTISSLQDSYQIFIPLGFTWGELYETRWISHRQVISEECQDFLSMSHSPMSFSLLPAFTSWLRWQSEPHQASHFLWAALSLAVVKVVEDQVVPGRRQQTQVCVWVMVCLLLGTAVPFSCYLILTKLVHNIVVGEWLFVTWSLDGP